MDKWPVVFRTAMDKINNRMEVLAVYAEYNPYNRLQCIPMYENGEMIIQESHNTMSMEYYHCNTKPLKDISTLEKFKRHLEQMYNEPIQVRKRLIRRF